MLVAGAIGVLAGVERFLSKGSFGVPAPSNDFRRQELSAPKRVDRFVIRRTRSDLGYTYWVLQGYGCFRGFTLFDSWAEAIEEAEQRLTGRTTAQEVSSLSASVGV